jgi:hypothetical protein
MSRKIYCLKVTLADVRPPVWRRVVVPGAFTLDRVHRVIQLAMGWQDCHLHSFEINAAQYGLPDPDGLLEMRDELEFRLDEVAENGSHFTYTYDFGDWWEHEIVVEAVLPADPEARYPSALAGEGECPPEDVGGAYGYDRFRAAMSDKTHKDHEAMLEWYGDRLDARDFDVDRATALMRRMA